MKAFAMLLDRLAFTPGRLGKLRLIEAHFAATPDPDRGYALAALTGGLAFDAAKPAMIRALVATRVDAALFEWSYDFVGDLAETVALIWPQRPGANREPELTEVVEGLSAAKKTEVPALVERWLDALDANGRWALLKLITGGLRVGVSARLAKTALAQFGAGNGQTVDVGAVEEVWHGLTPPYEALFAWLEGRAPRPSVDSLAMFRPLMLANPIEAAELAGLDPADYAAEWKWDGIRVQIVARADGGLGGSLGQGESRLFSRTGDDVGGAFPDLVGALDFDAVLDGELLVCRDGVVAPFNDLQQRLNRKVVTAKMLADYPAFLRLYDILFEGGEDLRPLPFMERRRRLEAWHAATAPRSRMKDRMDLSPLVPFASWDELTALRDGARMAGIEGLMLKRCDSPYVSGRPKGPWFKWKRGALTLDVVVMYAQRGHGKRSSYYSDYTFGAWRGDPTDGAAELVPVGKAYFGFTDAELLRLDKWVRDNTIDRFGPVRQVRPGLVLEVAFDSVHPSTRHKSGLAMRFPRVHRIRWDKPPEEADRVETLAAMVVS
ncbi:cisplatin damage response ATP-dependent DNA ligase [Rhodospirillaceae bacterium SYSU D60014]|uniref:cisplatin damage response ATP-dependent DNA ligase n=1 Tax=Virgifigura deserti TaxID=2268457 RepID=UPI000E6661D3